MYRDPSYMDKPSFARDFASLDEAGKTKVVKTWERRAKKVGTELRAPVGKGDSDRLINYVWELRQRVIEAGAERGSVTSQSPDGHELFEDDDNWPWWRRLMARFIGWLEYTFLPDPPGFVCYDCEEYGHGWMVENEVWEQICKSEGWHPENPYVIYCCECAEKRLGRKLTIEDFPTDVRINRPLRFGHELGIRQAERARKEST